MNAKTEKAWDLYLDMEEPKDSFLLLQVIANDSYTCGNFLFAARAFGILGS
eukprot:CAMPEP_0183317552 /NCGR_PEP_ID=MMETSP0160_2-20130417/58233_1 /TAXON_ID=2839 ORGANISM="Odontella Sinensis, Strain Grunow 1884" /NCGR_SAMPLE_ID=MMETSP0160_2 /ASSEMBLY_ACC=CAM_ASM_000250 /LENGTH=50 /DNA_ID=CAMNT_0025483599 /DNA_START=20 /DNA_END=169 /DNA_ORIENTATION=-